MFIKASDGGYILANQIYELGVKSSYSGYSVVCWGVQSGQSVLQGSFPSKAAAQGALGKLVSDLEVNESKLDFILQRLESIMATQAELAAEVTQVKDQLTKIGTETTSLLTKIAELTAVIAAGGPVTPELQAAVDSLKAQANVVDALVPDATPPSP